ncbi:hypothetical protein CKAH01_07540 [Colletotrichum kahawae]|uniref:Uncharacterized protein n=1 Tax=Colletotrichum kahawae TaxID=34407 RepID=A0AAD9Y645_COLKA|nr:hypothetical protein CKAH01_07540 [Colletotrichum kahawae]
MASSQIACLFVVLGPLTPSMRPIRPPQATFNTTVSISTRQWLLPLIFSPSPLSRLSFLPRPRHASHVADAHIPGRQALPSLVDCMGFLISTDGTFPSLNGQLKAASCLPWNMLRSLCHL